METFIFIYKYVLLFFTCIIDYQFCFVFFDIFYSRRPYFEKKCKILIPFLAGIFITFGMNLFGNTYLNLCTIPLLFVYAYIIFDVRIGNCLLTWLCYVVSIMVSEIIPAVIFYIESLVVTDLDYSTLIEAPGSMLMMMIIKYIPIMVSKQLFSKSPVKMKTKTFLMYLIIPIVNIFCITLISLFQMDPNSLNFKMFITVYCILIFIGTYLIFYSFQRHSTEIEKEYVLMENQMKSTSDNELLYLSAKAMRNRLKAAEEKMEAERIIRHDRRHFEGMLYELLEQGNVEQVKDLLEKRLNIEPAKLRQWCCNETINATMEYYVKKAEEADIKIDVSLNIPKELSVDSLQFAIALGNLIENAINANKKLPEEDRFINMKAVYKKQLLVSIENACGQDVKLNEDGYPFTSENGHGIGTKSVLAFIQQNYSDIYYDVNNGVFKVQMMLSV